MQRYIGASGSRVQAETVKPYTEDCMTLNRIRSQGSLGSRAKPRCFATGQASPPRGVRSWVAKHDQMFLFSIASANRAPSRPYSKVQLDYESRIGLPHVRLVRILWYQDERLRSFHECTRFRTPHSDHPRLRNLQLRFQSWDDGYCYSPWGYRRSSIPSVPAVCCQRVMVDWIMTFAWPFIKEVSIVTIDGAVKEESKTRGGTLLALSKKDRVVAFNQPFAVRKILQTLHNLL
jgi:hypothetical protein